MKLNEQHIAILKGVRRKLNEHQESSWYICHILVDVISTLRMEELSRMRNHILFWRRYSISDKWIRLHAELHSAVQYGIEGNSTVGNWFENRTRRLGIKLPLSERHNRRLYNQIRLAWLDRSIETGELH
jgi:hypothetical protein